KALLRAVFNAVKQSFLGNFLLHILITSSGGFVFFSSVWTDETSCTIVNSTIVWDVNCSYSCGTECWKRSRYPCLQVYVSLNSSGKNSSTLYTNTMQVLVQNISERLRSQHTLQCFVDRTDKTDSAILTQIYSQIAVFHSLFWPTCTLIGGSVIIAMVKLTQYLSVVCDRLSRITR
uniref:Potassium calcium-activated channel subfamily M regulatory beta subunit 2 n=1 Tax=Neolamprologus brichardi TaxID=32507 RepID=A0A3Q4MMQ1_NEOBR